MNREIKFRAWDGDRMCTVLTWGFYEQFITTNKLGSDESDFEIMEFTGITDKNGKDIYEKDYLSDGKIIYLVEYNTQNTGFYINPIKKINGVIDIIDELNYSKLGNGYYSRKDLEVVGNPFENPELL